MIDTKSSVPNRKHTLLHYLAELLNSDFPKIAKFHEDLTNVEEGSKVAIANIRQGLVGIRNDLNSLGSLLKEMKENKAPVGDMNAKFIEVMEKFEVETRRFYESMDKDFKSANDKFEQAAEHFGEDPKTITPEEFFGFFSRFCREYIVANNDNEAAIVKVAQDQKREAAKKQEDEKRKINRISKAPEAKKDGLDDLISSIRTGKAFGNAAPPDPNIPTGSMRARRAGQKAPAAQGLFQPPGSEQGAVGRLRRVENSDSQPAATETKPNALAKLLAKDTVKGTPKH